MKRLFLAFVATTLVLPAAVIAQTAKTTSAGNIHSHIRSGINTSNVDMNATTSNSATNGDTGPGLNSGSGMVAGQTMGSGSNVGSSEKY